MITNAASSILVLACASWAFDSGSMLFLYPTVISLIGRNVRTDHHFAEKRQKEEVATDENQDADDEEDDDDDDYECMTKHNMTKNGNDERYGDLATVRD
jgi:hypothetical protein